MDEAAILVDLVSMLILGAITAHAVAPLRRSSLEKRRRKPIQPFEQATADDISRAIHPKTAD